MYSEPYSSYAKHMVTVTTMAETPQPTMMFWRVLNSPLRRTMKATMAYI